MARILDAETQWSYHDNPKVVGGIVAGAAILGIALALALNTGSDRTKVATAPSSQAPVTAPPVIPVPPVGSTVEPKT